MVTSKAQGGDCSVLVMRRIRAPLADLLEQEVNVAVLSREILGFAYHRLTDNPDLVSQVTDQP